MKTIRINELARELEVKPKVIIDLLPDYGVSEKKTHSSSIDEDVAIKVKHRLGFEGDLSSLVREESGPSESSASTSNDGAGSVAEVSAPLPPSIEFNNRPVHPGAESLAPSTLAAPPVVTTSSAPPPVVAEAPRPTEPARPTSREDEPPRAAAPAPSQTTPPARPGGAFPLRPPLGGGRPVVPPLPGRTPAAAPPVPPSIPVPPPQAPTPQAAPPPQAPAPQPPVSQP